MTFSKGTARAVLTLIATWMMSADLLAQDGPSQTLSFEAPGAGTAAGQGTGCFGCTFAINQWGAVVGTYVDANNVYHGFVRSPQGQFTTFEAPGADTTAGSYHGTIAQGVNDWGEITGFYSDSAGLEHGFVRTPQGTYSTFDALSGAYVTVPVYINLEGISAGYVLDSTFLFHAFLRYPNGDLAVFVGPNSCTSGTPAGCYGSEATYADLVGGSVANFQDDSGNFVSHGLLRRPSGKSSTFDAPGAGAGFYQGTGCPGCNMGVNFSGAIAGTFTDANYVFHGFLRNPDGTFATFEAPGAGSGPLQGTGCFSDCPVALNDWGQITGSYQDANSTQHGFLRSPEGTIVTIDPPGSTDTQPEAINDAGTITGYYQDQNGVFHGFIRRGAPGW